MFWISDFRWQNGVFSIILEKGCFSNLGTTMDVCFGWEGEGLNRRFSSSLVNAPRKSGHWWHGTLSLTYSFNIISSQFQHLHSWFKGGNRCQTPTWTVYVGASVITDTPLWTNWVRLADKSCQINRQQDTEMRLHFWNNNNTITYD